MRNLAVEYASVEGVVQALVMPVRTPGRVCAQGDAERRRVAWHIPESS